MNDQAKHEVHFEDVEGLHEAARLVNRDPKTVIYHLKKGNIIFDDGAPAWRHSGKTVLIDMRALRQYIDKHGRTGNYGNRL